MLAYVVLAIGLSWVVWVPGLLLVPDEVVLGVLVLGAFGPAVAAALMVRAGGGSLRAWVRDMAVFRLPLRWYLAALAVPLVIPAAVTVVAVASGLPWGFHELPARLPGYLFGLVFVLLLGGGQEEPGWRGYLLPRLQTRTSPLVASAVVGVLWAVWHLPLFVLGFEQYAGRPFELYVPQLVGLAVVFTWLYNATRGSVVLAMLLHAGVNQSENLAPITGQLSPTTEYVTQAAITVAWLVFAGVLVARYGTRLRAKPLDADVTGANVGDSAATPSPRPGDRHDENVESNVGRNR